MAGFAVKVGLFGCAVGERLVGSDGVVDGSESMGFHIEGVSIADVTAVEMLVFEGFEEPLDYTVGLPGFDPGPHSRSRGSSP